MFKKYLFLMCAVSALATPDKVWSDMTANPRTTAYFTSAKQMNALRDCAPDLSNMTHRLAIQLNPVYAYKKGLDLAAYEAAISTGYASIKEGVNVALYPIMWGAFDTMNQMLVEDAQGILNTIEGMGARAATLYLLKTVLENACDDSKSDSLRQQLHKVEAAIANPTQNAGDAPVAFVSAPMAAEKGGFFAFFDDLTCCKSDTTKPQPSFANTSCSEGKVDSDPWCMGFTLPQLPACPCGGDSQTKEIVMSVEMKPVDGSSAASSSVAAPNEPMAASNEPVAVSSNGPIGFGGNSVTLKRRYQLHPDAGLASTISDKFAKPVIVQQPVQQGQ